MAESRWRLTLSGRKEKSTVRALLILAYLANLCLTIAILRHQPARVLANHGALPIIILIVLYTVLLAAILLAPRLLKRCPARWMNVPNPGYWLLPENRAAAERKIGVWLVSFGTVTFLILLLAGAFVLRFQQAPRAQPEWWQLRGALIAFLGYSVSSYFGMLRDFQVPTPHD